MHTCIFAWNFSDIEKKRSPSSRAYSLNTVVVKSTCLLMKLNLLWNYFFPMEMSNFSKLWSGISMFFPIEEGFFCFLHEEGFTTFIFIIAKGLQVFQPNYIFPYLLIKVPTLLGRGQWIILLGSLAFQESVCIKICIWIIHK